MKKKRVYKGIYFFTTKLNTTIELKGLSHKEILLLEEMFVEKTASTFLRAFELGFIRAFKNDIEIDKNMLTYEEMKSAGEFIYNMSQITEEEYQKLQLSVDIFFDNQFKNETWQCNVCQAKKLDRFRNCGYRNELNKNPNFKIYVGNKIYTHCPIYDVDKEILGEAIECFNAFDNGFLIEKGGLYDQTKFFILASTMIRQKINEEQKKEIENLNKETSVSS